MSCNIIFLEDEAWFPGGLALGCGSAGGPISNLTLDVVKLYLISYLIPSKFAANIQHRVPFVLPMG